MKVLVTGAAGYIGSVVTELLIEQGNDVIALDNLMNGHRAAVHPKARLVQGDLADAAGCQALLQDNPIDAVVHLAGEALIDVSMRNPGLFFRANVTNGLNLLDAMVVAGVKRIVFSSTAAVYGEPTEIPIPEEAAKRPINPYGESKLAFERMLAWYRLAHNIGHISLRYFNACGATRRCGEHHVPETHIIPILFEVALGQRERFELYGTDYDTSDGTCLRDYVHVVDIAQAHILALAKIDEIGAGHFNLGNSTGYTNRQVVDRVGRITGREIQVRPAARRPGDPARLVASSQRIRATLGWTPRFSDLDTIVETAWAWRVEHPYGYDD